MKNKPINDDLPEVVEHWGKDNRKIYANEYVDNSNSSWYMPDAVISERMSQAERSELWGRLIDVVEDWLTEKGTSVGKHEDAAIVCGSDYDYLADRFADAVGISRDCADVRKDSKKQELESVLGIKITTQQMDLISVQWKAFYDNPAVYRDSVVVEVVRQFLTD